MMLRDTHKRHGAAFLRAGITTRDSSVDDVLPAISRGLNRDGHRFDLRIHRNAMHRRGGYTCAEVSYSERMGMPEPEDLAALIARHFPDSEVVIDDVFEVGAGTLSVPVVAAGARIPVADPSRVPDGFRHIAGGVFMRADAAGVRWSLERDAASGQFALVRIEDEPAYEAMGELQAAALRKAARPKVGQEVVTPDGSGVMVDRVGDDPIVEVAGRRYRYLQAQVEPKKDPGMPENAFGRDGYNAKRDLQYEEKYYDWLYGPDFAAGMVRDFSPRG